MLKKNLFALSILSLFLLISCDNLVEGNYGRNNISFSLGEGIAESISKTVTANDEITEDTKLKISCELLRGEVAFKEEVANVALKDLYKTSFSFNDIPLGNNYFISLKIYYSDILIYKALSDIIKLNDDNNNPVINLQLQQNKSKIKYELNGGYFKNGQKGAEEYFIDSTIKLPELEDENLQFDGWYDNSDFSGEKVTELGSKKFVGDITLYAKWITIIYSVKFDPNGGSGPLMDNKQLLFNDNTAILTKNTYTKSGFVFAGWNTLKDGSGQSIEDEHTGTALNLSKKRDDVVTIYAQWTDVVPDPVSGLTATTGNGKIILNWTNPVDEDIAKVVITSEPGVKIDDVTAGATSKEITGLTNGTKYTFTVKAVDNGGNNSSEMSVSQYPMYPLTETPEILTNYTSDNTTPVSDPAQPTGSNGDWMYVKFGDYPQTVKTENVTLSTETTTVNNWNCYYGSDGYYYVENYASLYDKPPSSGYKFDDDSVIEEYQTYYFKLEPIKWRVLTNNYIDADNNNKGKLLLAERALCVRSFNGYDSNNYANSNMRTFLNGDFIKKAFSSEAQKKINTTTADNSAETTNHDGTSSEPNRYACENTSNKIFLLSYSELKNNSYGFEVTPDNKPTIRKATDYAKISYAELQNGGWCAWLWLRSPDYRSSREVLCVNSGGYAQARSSSDGWMGVLPALCLPEEAFTTTP